MSEEGQKDPNEEHERELIRGRDHVPDGLTDAGNKPPPQEVPFKLGGNK